MGANQGKYPEYPCVDSDSQLIFLDPESEGIQLNHINLTHALQLSKTNRVPFYTQNHGMFQRWQRIRGGSMDILDFLISQ